MAPHYFHPHTGGIEIVAQQHATRLADRGHDVVVVSSDVEAEWRTARRDGYRIERYRAFNPLEGLGIPYPLPDPADLKQVVEREVNGRGTDVLHVHGMNYMTAGLVQMFSSDAVPVVLQQHTPFVEYPFPWSTVERANDRLVGRKNVSWADKTVCVSENISEYVTDICDGCDPEVLYNGVDVSRFAPERGDVRPTGVDDSRPTFFCLSRLLYKKGVDVLLEAARELERRGVDAKILIAGTGPDRSEIESQARRLPNVEVLGYVEDDLLPSYYAASTASLFTSKSGETFPTLTVLEALASGTPVVATKINERAEGITDGYNGLLVRPDDATELADAMERLANDPDLVEEMSENARTVAVEQFDIEDNVDRLEDVYGELT
ncbi:glycosyltransferase family 4 protein [Halopelagius longus]|uniref:glycosyltransferase family 4 protein n=1 Tax=Halopelagius longus TaxID=1236180 RepID=UPI003743E6C0